MEGIKGQSAETRRVLGEARVVNLVFGHALINGRSGGWGHKIGRAVEICADHGWISVRNGSRASLPAVTGRASK
jgi:hypothetical protein